MKKLGATFLKESGLFDPLNILLPSSWMMERERGEGEGKREKKGKGNREQ